MPSCTIYDVECPDHSFRKFTDDGQYLISFSRNQQDLIVYRPTWLTFSCKDEDCDTHDLPLKSKRFESFFTQLYCVPLVSSGEFICKDFFLYIESNQFGLFATSTTQIHDAPAAGGAIPGIPYIEKITFHLLRCASFMSKFTSLMVQNLLLLFTMIWIDHPDWKMELYLTRGFSAMIMLMWPIVWVCFCMTIYWL